LANLKAMAHLLRMLHYQKAMGQLPVMLQMAMANFLPAMGYYRMAKERLLVWGYHPMAKEHLLV
jgi:hypothetical protein